MTLRHSQEQQQQQQEFLHDNASQSFSGGVMHIRGVPQRPLEVVVWESTNGNTHYSTVLWEDPATGQRRTSCNCPGWAMKKAGKSHRECKHTRDMEGISTCNANRVEATRIQSVEQAVAAIDTIVDGKELRGITF